MAIFDSGIFDTNIFDTEEVVVEDGRFLGGGGPWSVEHTAEYWLERAAKKPKVKEPNDLDDLDEDVSGAIPGEVVEQPVMVPPLDRILRTDQLQARNQQAIMALLLAD